MGEHVLPSTRLPQENIYGHTKKLRFILQEIDRQLETRPWPISLLDFGCGNGNAVSQYLIREGVRYYGVDIHQPSLEYARNAYASENAAFLDDLPEGVLFDVIVYSDNLEHLDQPVEFLMRHAKLLRPDGVIIGAIPNGYGPFEIENRIDRWLRLSQMLDAARGIKRKLRKQAGRQTFELPYNHESGHLQFFTKNSLERVFNQAGFDLIRFQNGGFVGASLSDRVLRIGRLPELNAKIADKLPHWAVSTWYFIAARNGSTASLK